MDAHRNFPRILSIITVLWLATQACTLLTGSQGSSGELIPVCTPPACARNEAFACQGDCPGGCGTFCALFTPAPEFMYTTLELVDISLSDHILQISMDVPGIEGIFYGVISRENFECSIRQPEQFPDRLFCTGNLWSGDETQTLRVYRTGDDQQAFIFDFLVP